MGGVTSGTAQLTVDGTSKSVVLDTRAKMLGGKNIITYNKFEHFVPPTSANYTAEMTVEDGRRCLHINYTGGNRNGMSFQITDDLIPGAYYTLSYLIKTNASRTYNFSNIGHHQFLDRTNKYASHAARVIVCTPGSIPANTWTRVHQVLKLYDDVEIYKSFLFFWYLDNGDYYFADWSLCEGYEDNDSYASQGFYSNGYQYPISNYFYDDNKVARAFGDKDGNAIHSTYLKSANFTLGNLGGSMWETVDS